MDQSIKDLTSQMKSIKENLQALTNTVQREFEWIKSRLEVNEQDQLSVPIHSSSSLVSPLSCTEIDSLTALQINHHFDCLYQDACVTLSGDLAKLTPVTGNSIDPCLSKSNFSKNKIDSGVDLLYHEASNSDAKTESDDASYLGDVSDHSTSQASVSLSAKRETTKSEGKQPPGTKKSKFTKSTTPRHCTRLVTGSRLSPASRNSHYSKRCTNIVRATTLKNKVATNQQDKQSSVSVVHETKKQKGIFSSIFSKGRKPNSDYQASKNTTGLTNQTTGGHLTRSATIGGYSEMRADKTKQNMTQNISEVDSKSSSGIESEGDLSTRRSMSRTVEVRCVDKLTGKESMEQVVLRQVRDQSSLSLVSDDSLRDDELAELEHMSFVNRRSLWERRSLGPGFKFNLSSR